jgi:hypothetical protein
MSVHPREQVAQKYDACRSDKAKIGKIDDDFCRPTVRSMRGKVGRHFRQRQSIELVGQLYSRGGQCDLKSITPNQTSKISSF